MSTTNYTWPDETSPLCFSCQAEAVKMATGSFPSQQAQNHWSMFGCTCAEGAVEAVQAFIEAVTR